jgi:chitin disaccharide deacetylase
VRSTSPESRKALRAAGVRTPDHFIAEFHAENVSYAALERILEGLPDGTSELMCHPGHADEELKSGSTYADEREWEIEVLCDPRIRQLADRRKIVRIGFGAL